MSMGRTKSRKPTVPLKSKLKKDPGIPRLPDLKERVRNAGKQRAPPVSTSHASDPDSTMASEPTLSTLARLAAESSSQPQLDDPSSSSSGVTGKTKEQMRRHYLRTLHKVIDQSDIIILVLDARDPEGCRSRLVEEEVRRREMEGKKLVFVLNKIDLIPRTNAQSWLKHLRHSTPTLPFLSSASSQHQRTNISSSTAPSLLRLLKAYKPKSGSVTVGVVGYPNVGKSSLINSMKRSKVCAVAAQAGHTKDLQSVQLERGMRIIDSPGVVFDEDEDAGDGKGQKKGSVLLRNVVKVEDVEDPIAVVEEILARTPSPTIQKIYNLPEFTSTLEFLTMLAMSTGRLLKGGTPDLNSAARVVLADWNHQKIPYYSLPPETHPSLIPSTIPANHNSSAGAIIAPGAENVGQAQILNAFSKPFELAGLFGAADAGAFGEERDIAMADEDGDIFWDAMEGDPMDEDNARLRTDEPHTGQKRLRSPSLAPTPDLSNAPMTSIDVAEPTSRVRQPKRQRKSKNVPAYDAPLDDHVLKRMDRSNPLSRKNLKKEAKRVRKAHRIKTDAGTGSMEVDDDGLQFTFMA